jgi:hypothetical protein
VRVTVTFELGASEVANPRPDDPLTVSGETFVVQESRSAEIPTRSYGRWTHGLRERLRAQVGRFVAQPVSVRVIARRPDTIVGFGETRIHAETATFELRASEVASPHPGDLLIVDSQTFVVQGEPEHRDPDRLGWTIDTRPFERHGCSGDVFRRSGTTAATAAATPISKLIQ